MADINTKWSESGVNNGYHFLTQEYSRHVKLDTAELTALGLPDDGTIKFATLSYVVNPTLSAAIAVTISPIISSSSTVVGNVSATVLNPVTSLSATVTNIVPTTVTNILSATVLNTAFEIANSYGIIADISPTGEMRMTETYRLCGGIFSSYGNIVDPNFWSSVMTGTATATALDSELVLSTGTSANSVGLVESVSLGRYIGALCNYVRCVIRIPDGGTANNIRLWGCNGGTSAMFFALSGSVMNIGYKKSGVETFIPIGSWNVDNTAFTVTQNRRYEIYYLNSRFWFFVDGVLKHIAQSTTVPLTNTVHFRTYLENRNINRSTTNVVLNCPVITINWLGPKNTSPKYFNMSAPGTYMLKYSPGSLHRIVINKGAGNNSSMILYDSISGGGPVLATVDVSTAPNPVALDYGIDFNIGLTVITTGSSAIDTTIIYE